MKPFDTTQGKSLPLFLFSVLIGLVVLGIVLKDRTYTDVLSIPEQDRSFEVTLLVEEKAYQVSVPQDSSVYDLMRKAQETSDFQFRGKEFPGLGFFIQEINGLEQSPRVGKYWMYYVNGKKAEVGISAYMVKADDIISWKYEDEE